MHVLEDENQHMFFSYSRYFFGYTLSVVGNNYSYYYDSNSNPFSALINFIVRYLTFIIRTSTSHHLGNIIAFSRRKKKTKVAA